MDFLGKAATAALNATSQGTQQQSQYSSSSVASSDAAGYGQQQKPQGTQQQNQYSNSSGAASGDAAGYGQQQKLQDTQQQSQYQSQSQSQQSSQQTSGSLLGNAFNSALGGGAQGEKNEDMLDKGIDMIQEKIFKQGDQSNESAQEQAKDKMIADAIRTGYKMTVGKEFPVEEKQKDSTSLSSLAGAASGFFGKK
ncbi:hypothetical protein QBC44DRAFT_117812 [Cladorrhinum sp. PSN332]|nr:hypothetical protein QBC44DRAFT_117812 [Cladorrhinum sp. PSN332]